MKTSKVLVLLTTLSISSFSFAEAKWATKVHSHFLDQAFYKKSSWCRAQMKLGSIAADSADFQGSKFSYMHAMRTEDQTPEEAEERMWRFIRKKYKEIREETAKYTKDPAASFIKSKACFNRGIALHPIMDMTSPAHAGFKIWDPLDIGAALEHGDLHDYLKEKTGFSFGIPHSHEDMETLHNMPTLKASTIRIMREVDSTLMEGDDDTMRYHMERIN